MDWWMLRPALAREPLMKEFIDTRRRQAIASSLRWAVGARK